jgi:hypothetical protein
MSGDFFYKFADYGQIRNFRKLCHIPFLLISNNFLYTRVGMSDLGGGRVYTNSNAESVSKKHHANLAEARHARFYGPKSHATRRRSRSRSGARSSSNHRSPKVFEQYLPNTGTGKVSSNTAAAAAKTVRRATQGARRNAAKVAAFARLAAKKAKAKAKRDAKHAASLAAAETAAHMSVEANAGRVTATEAHRAATVAATAATAAAQAEDELTGLEGLLSGMKMG